MDRQGQNTMSPDYCHGGHNYGKSKGVPKFKKFMKIGMYSQLLISQSWSSSKILILENSLLDISSLDKRS